MDDQDPLMLSQKPPYIRPINSHSVQVVFKVGQKLEAETRSQKPEARNQKPETRSQRPEANSRKAFLCKNF